MFRDQERELAWMVMSDGVTAKKEKTRGYCDNKATR